MEQINNIQFNNLTKENKVTVVDFFAVWCGPCKMMHPVLEQAERQFTNIKFAQVDIDKFTELAIAQGVNAVPTIIAYKNGKEIARTMGYSDFNEFSGFLNTLK